jgi:serine/threonine-protein kinase
MDEREHRVLQVLRGALDAAPGGREEFLTRNCAGDDTLRRRVDSLLRGCVDEVGADTVIEAHGAPDDALIGVLLGSFRVVERIGRGGMGVVYRGMREGPDFAHEVAIKLIRHGFDFDDIRARFLRERRILARLEHPDIARLIDGGVTAANAGACVAAGADALVAGTAVFKGGPDAYAANIAAIKAA